LIAAADFRTMPTFDGYGITLVSLSVVADAFLPNVQERLFDKGASRAEVSYCTNLLCLGSMTTWLLYTGELQAAMAFSISSRWNLTVMLGYAVLSYVAISFHMTMVKEFGGVTAVIVGNLRKVLSVVLSFFFFPKPFSWLYVAGGLLVFGSLTASEITKEMQKKEAKRAAAAQGGAAYYQEGDDERRALLNADNRGRSIELTGVGAARGEKKFAEASL
jgi:solute carrier family 35 (adenosine 3'-phospho 5'-phosphosulfate transporter), member B3